MRKRCVKNNGGGLLHYCEYVETTIIFEEGITLFLCIYLLFIVKGEVGVGEDIEFLNGKMTSYKM